MVVLVVSGCGDDPYSRLSDEIESLYVIPDSARWATGDPCSEDCGGEITVDIVQGLSWVVVERVHVPAGTAPDARHIDVAIDFGAVRSGAVSEARIEQRVWGQDVRWVLEAAAEGHEIWVGLECQLRAESVPCLASMFVAFDEQGRFAGLGYGAGRLFTTPLAREAADGGALTGRQFFESILAS